MSRPNDGGPAFPAVIPLEYAEHQGKSYPNYSEAGMTLRAYFAAKNMAAMVGAVTNETDYLRLRGIANYNGVTVSQLLASRAREHADALIEELKK